MNARSTHKMLYLIMSRWQNTLVLSSWMMTSVKEAFSVQNSKTLVCLNRIKPTCVKYNYSNTDHFSEQVVLPGMTERSLTLSATAFGLSEVALEGWNNNTGSQASLLHTSLYTLYSVWGCCTFFFFFFPFYLSLLHSLCEAIFRHTLRFSSELKRGMPKHSSRGTHSSSDERSERKGLSEARRDMGSDMRPLSHFIHLSASKVTERTQIKIT